MSEHELTISYTPAGFGQYCGACTCGWTCRRSRERDLKREFRKHIGAEEKIAPCDDAEFGTKP